MGNVNFFHRFMRLASGRCIQLRTERAIAADDLYDLILQLQCERASPLAGRVDLDGRFQWNYSGLTNYRAPTARVKAIPLVGHSQTAYSYGFFSQSTGISLLGAGGLVPVTATPGVTDFIIFGGTTYGGSLSVSPFRRMVIAGSFSRAISNTLAKPFPTTIRKSSMRQMQYHLRRIGLQAGYTALHARNQCRGGAGEYHIVFCRSIQMVRLLLG